MACELYCCLLPQCEALRICRSGFPIATVVSDQYRHSYRKIRNWSNSSFQKKNFSIFEDCKNGPTIIKHCYH